jgi:hypothetical protein
LRPQGVLSHLVVAAFYLLVALVFTWPLPLHPSTHLLGDPRGDTGVYVWNLWVFHQGLAEGHSPFYTHALFAPLGERVWLVLHNYTVFADLVAVPLRAFLDLITTFNVVYWAMSWANAFAFFLLAHYLTRDRAAAFLAGLAFGFSPFLVTRGTAHFSLATAVAIPVFLLLVLKARDTLRMRYAAAAGVAMTWALLCDAYYGIYCALIGAYVILASALEVSFDPGSPTSSRQRGRQVVDVLLVVVAALIAWMALTGGGDIALGGLRLGLRGLHTPVLVFTLLLLVRWAIASRVRVRLQPDISWGPATRLIVCGVGAATLACLPLLQAFGAVLAAGGYVQPAVFWRSSPPGVDMLAFVLPNPNHPFWNVGRAWLTSQPNGFVENVASQGFVVLGVLALAFVRRKGSLPVFWCGFTAFFALLAMGPFIRIAGLQTYVPTPWALLRYVPLVANARSPTRFAVVATLGIGLLFAYALAALLAGPKRRSLVQAMVGVALLFELTPVPRFLFSASVPRVYERIAADRSDIVVLELPVGVRSGASSVGDFSAFSQLCQTVHGKPLVGGYLSRVEDRWVELYRKDPVMDALLTLSSKEPSAATPTAAPVVDGRGFCKRARVGYVVVDTNRASAALQQYAVATLHLTKIDTDGAFELYVPETAPSVPKSSDR